MGGVDTQDPETIPESLVSVRVQVESPRVFVGLFLFQSLTVSPPHWCRTSTRMCARHPSVRSDFSPEPPVRLLVLGAGRQDPSGRFPST